MGYAEQVDEVASAAAGWAGAFEGVDRSNPKSVEVLARCEARLLEAVNRLLAGEEK